MRGLKRSHLGILEGFMSSCERRFDRLGGRLDFACPLGPTQPRAGMVQPIVIVRNGYYTSEPIYSLAEVKFTFLEPV